VTLKQMEVLVLLGQLRNYTLTAQRLGSTQSAVSHTIKLLEKETGITIFYRVNNELRFTEFGERLHCKAETILNLTHSIKEDAHFWRDKKSGIVRLGSFGPSTTIHLLPKYLETFNTRFPNIEIQIFEGRDREVLHWLDTHIIDFGFVVLPKPNLETLEVLTDHLVAVMSTHHPLSVHNKLTLNDISKFPFILTQAGSSELVENLFQQQGLSLKPQYSCTQLISTLDILTRSESVSILAQSAIPAQLLKEFGLVVRHISNVETQRKVGIAFKDRSLLSPAAQTFWAFINSAKTF
jgi:DNA-binding transcriptional LysR family regulator